MGKKLRGRVQGRDLDSSAIEGVGTFIYCTATKRYLFILRNTKKYAGTWGLAGGGIEPGENLLESLYRELDEELGYDFSQTKVIPIEKFTSDNNYFSYHTFLIAVDEEFVPILNSEHRGFCWVSLEDHPKPLHPGVWRTINFASVVDKIKTVEAVLQVAL
jgi:8-oxo-dGTP pyrophosphatase MutT (NUDIX family)